MIKVDAAELMTNLMGKLVTVCTDGKGISI